MAATETVNVDAPGPPEDTPTPPPVSATMSAIALFAALIVAGGIVAVSLFSEDKSVPTLVAAGIVGVAVAVTAGTRFWYMLLGIFVVRSSLDGFKMQNGTNGLDPGTVVGALFIVMAVVWLLAQHRAGRLQPISRSCRAVMCLAAAAMASALGAAIPIDALQSASKLVSVALMLIVLEQHLALRPDRIRQLMAAFFCSLVVPVAFAYYQAVSGTALRATTEPTIGRVLGTFVHPNPFATYLITCILAGVALFPHVRKRYRFWLAMAIIVPLPMLFLTYSRSGWLGLIVGLIVIGLLQDKRLLVALVVGLVLVVAVVPSAAGRFSDLSKTKRVTATADPNSLAWRWRYWGEIIPYAKSTPIVGIGSEMTRRTNPAGFDPHNGFVQAFVEMGLFGLTSLLGVIVLVLLDIRRGLKRFRERSPERAMCVAAAACAAGVLTVLPSENVLVSAANWWYLLVPISWVLATSNTRRRSQAPVVALASDERVDASV